VATSVFHTVPRRADVPAIFALGLCLFLNQLLYILGLNLAGVTLATCLQPSIPVFTAVLSMLCGQEDPSAHRISGTRTQVIGISAVLAQRQRVRTIHRLAVLQVAHSDEV
jgi:drug/metabolite transporter (DMT)-like permease